MTRKSFKYIKFPLLLIMVLLVVISFSLLVKEQLKQEEKNISTNEVKKQELAKETKTKPSACNYKDTINYFYYKEPVPKTNNKFGLYIYAEVGDFFELAQNLVNSNGGDWGYVLIPYNINDHDDDKWNTVFERLNKKHLIPIIQLWDVNPDNYRDKTKDAAKFLDNFIWPIKERYVSVYNEPNDAKFWNGKTDPESYAHVLDYTIKIFKKQDTNFFMLNGAFNTSASTQKDYMDAETFMYLMNQEVEGIFEELDGWASHSYPQPNFSGVPYTYGRLSIRAYDKELEFLKKTLGVKKDLPVFITETGWAHAEGDTYNSSYLSAKTAAQYFETAYKDFWLKDDRIRAITPFTVFYNPPFDHFSWINKDYVPYEQYDVIKNMEKVAGTPTILEKGTIEVMRCNT